MSGRNEDRAISYRTPSARKQFIPLHCSALTRPTFSFIFLILYLGDFWSCTFLARFPRCGVRNSKNARTILTIPSGNRVMWDNFFFSSFSSVWTSHPRRDFWFRRYQAVGFLPLDEFHSDDRLRFNDGLTGFFFFYIQLQRKRRARSEIYFQWNSIKTNQFQFVRNVKTADERDDFLFFYGKRILIFNMLSINSTRYLVFLTISLVS